MAKVSKLQSADGETLMTFHCPGCGYGHSFRIKEGTTRSDATVWNWNGDVDKPTFRPSLLVMGDPATTRCHLFIQGGQIIFLNDCFHKLAGHTVDMKEDK